MFLYVHVLLGPGQQTAVKPLNAEVHTAGSGVDDPELADTSYPEQSPLMVIRVQAPVLTPAAAWLTVYVWPPIVRVPERETPVLAATV
jgi:hypothetical protein